MRGLIRIVLLVLLVPAVAAGWDAHGHRMVTYTALDLLPGEAPAWLREADVRRQIAYQSNEPDRWRATRSDVLAHENGPDHYIDVERLERFGLDLSTLPRRRYEYALLLSRAGDAAGDSEQGGDDAQADPTKDWPGFLPYAIAEHYAKLRSSFSTLRILKKLNDPARQDQLAAARANVIHEMGQLSHFVGDAAQPLHNTIHHHGWIGPNPHGYTTDHAFHRKIDGGVAALHAITTETLKAYRTPMASIDPGGAWKAALSEIQRSFDQVTPLYELERRGDLERDAGRDFIAARLADGASVLAGMYWSAYRDAEPTKDQIKGFVRYNNLKADAAH